MSARRRVDTAVGDALDPLTVQLDRAALVHYAAASGDRNPIHWSDRVAREVGLPDVIAHGMLTMALAADLVARWAGDPAAVLECRARFTRPVVVPDDGVGATVELTGTVKDIRDGDGAGTALIAVNATCAGRTVLGAATALVRLA